MSENNMITAEIYIKSLETTGQLSEPAIREAIKFLKLHGNEKILDIPCGTANHIKWMLEEYPDVNITGVDISEKHIEYAKNKLQNIDKNQLYELLTGDINKLEFDDDTFDLVWCCDGLWPGPKEKGCLAETPYKILNDMIRITKNGGKIAILFWSSQKLLPGYPYVEAILNATRSAQMPADPDSNPDLHFMRAPFWLLSAGLKDIHVKTFSADIVLPLSDKAREGVNSLFNMFWVNSKNEIPGEIWDKYKKLTNPDSDEYILNLNGYSGLLTYTLYSGIVSK